MDNTIVIETWGGGSRRTKRRASKLELVTEISKITGKKSLDITGLTISDLESILQVANENTRLSENAPSSRFKQPYINILEAIFPTVKLDKLPVAALKELLGAFNEE